MFVSRVNSCEQEPGHQVTKATNWHT